MVEDRVADGKRIAQLLSSELSGRETGPLASVAVVEADPSAEPAPEGTLAYRVARGDRPVGAVLLYPEAAVLALSLGLDALYNALGVGTASHGATDAAEGGGLPILAVGVLSSLLFVGPGEELLYRNVIQKRLYDALGRSGAVVVASLVFALMHGPTYLLGDLLPGLASLSVVFALSLVLGAAYVVTENVAVSAAIHGAYNAVSFAAVVLF